MMQYAVGLDGGGTKTAAVICGKDGTVLARASFGPMNCNSSFAETQITLEDCFVWLSRQPGGLAGCGAICLGSAGISNPDARRFLTENIRRSGYSGPLQVVGDQVTALAGALGRPVGTALVAGTGSICYARTAAGQERRVGGWGHLIDDEGSGYALGRDILRAAVRAADGRGPATILSGLVAKEIGSPDIDAIIRFTYAPDTTKKEIAALAPLLEPALQRNDAAAAAIQAHAVQELADMVATAVTPLGLQKGEVAMMGSVLEKNAAIRGSVQGRLRSRFPEMTFPAAKGDAAIGAAAMAAAAIRDKEDTENA